MSDYRHGYVRFQSREYKVTWHPISKDVYVYWGTDKYAGKAYDMQEALDIALSWLPKTTFENFAISLRARYAEGWTLAGE